MNSGPSQLSTVFSRTTMTAPSTTESKAMVTRTSGAAACPQVCVTLPVANADPAAAG